RRAARDRVHGARPDRARAVEPAGGRGHRADPHAAPGGSGRRQLADRRGLRQHEPGRRAAAGTRRGAGHGTGAVPAAGTAWRMAHAGLRARRLADAVPLRPAAARLHRLRGGEPLRVHVPGVELRAAPDRGAHPARPPADPARPRVHRAPTRRGSGAAHAGRQRGGVPGAGAGVRTAAARPRRVAAAVGRSARLARQTSQFGSASTWISSSPMLTTWPAWILQVFRSSTAPSTRTTPLATRCLPAPPLSHRPTSFSNRFSSTWSPYSSNSGWAMAFRFALVRGRDGGGHVRRQRKEGKERAVRL